MTGVIEGIAVAVEEDVEASVLFLQIVNCKNTEL